MSSTKSSYYLPAPSFWPLLASLSVFTLLVGGINWLHDYWIGPWLFFIGASFLAYVLFGWFSCVIRENQRGLYSIKEDRSFRWGMVWFIFTEICFFGTFFGALFHARVLAVPELGGAAHSLSHYLLWPDFKAVWPLLKNPDVSKYPAASQVMGAWGLPAINTLLLLTSGVTLTVAHWALKVNRRKVLAVFMALTVILGVSFLICQGMEYTEAYREYHLGLHTGIYGSTFFMLTGFHGLHVTIGSIMLLVILVRCLKGHFDAEHHFAFEAVAWYWHFVDVVWLFLFIFVYWL